MRAFVNLQYIASTCASPVPNVDWDGCMTLSSSTPFSDSSDRVQVWVARSSFGRRRSAIAKRAMPSVVPCYIGPITKGLPWSSCRLFELPTMETWSYESPIRTDVVGLAATDTRAVDFLKPYISQKWPPLPKVVPAHRDGESKTAAPSTFLGFAARLPAAGR
jgi:hypothetical protein